MVLREFISEDTKFSVFLVDSKEDSEGVYTDSLIKKAIEMRLIMSSILIHNLDDPFHDSLFMYHTNNIGKNYIEIRNNKVWFDFTNINKTTYLNKSLINKEGSLFIPDFLGKGLDGNMPSIHYSKKENSFDDFYVDKYISTTGNYDVASEFSQLSKAIDGRPSLVSVGVVLDKLLNVELSKAFLIKFNDKPTPKMVKKISKMPVVKDLFSTTRDDIEDIEEFFDIKFKLVKTQNYYLSNEQLNSLHFIRDTNDNDLEHAKLFLNIPITNSLQEFRERFNAWEPYLYRNKIQFNEYDINKPYLGVNLEHYITGGLYDKDYIDENGEGRSWEFQQFNKRKGVYSSGYFDDNYRSRPVGHILVKIKYAFLNGCEEFICSKYHEQEIQDYVPKIIKDKITFRFV